MKVKSKMNLLQKSIKNKNLIVILIPLVIKNIL